jgi:hypothetical protein
MDALHKLQDGNLALDTPPDPKTGATAVTLDPLEWIHRITAHIPDPGRHGQRFYGAYSNRARAAIARADGDNADAAANTYAQQNNSVASASEKGALIARVVVSTRNTLASMLESDVSMPENIISMTETSSRSLKTSSR